MMQEGQERGRRARFVKILGAISWRSVLAALGILGTSPPLPCSAHDSLYQVIEIHVDASGNRTLSISIHLAELATDFGVDPNRADLDWWPALSADEQKEILARADALLADRFAFDEKSLTGAFRHPFSRGGISEETTESARPGCLIATAALDRNIGKLKLTYTATEKRLMVVTTRPGAFPKVIDLAPGEHLVLPLP